MTGPDMISGTRPAGPGTRARRGEVTRRPVIPVPSRKRPVMAVLVPLVTFPGAGTSAGTGGGPWMRGPRLALSGPAGPVSAGRPAPAASSVLPERPGDHSGLWLRNAAAGLCVLAAGVALALHGRRAIRARALNLVSVSASVFMNAIAAGPGWRDLAIWVMPPAAYALASDTLIGIIRAWATARHVGTALAADEGTPLAALGGLVLWLLRLAVAPVSTLAGFRAWVVEECPVAPGRRAPRPAPLSAEAVSGRGRAPLPRRGTKTGRFLDLAAEQHGLLGLIPIEATSRIAAALAPQAGLNTGAARAALRKAVLAAQSGELR